MDWMRCVTRPRASHVVTRTRRTMDACERAERGDYAWFTALDDDGLRRACAARDDDGRSALHRACAAGTRGREVVRALVTSAYGGAKLAACADEGEWTCLHTAASMGESETCGLLLAVHAEGANARTPGGQTPGHYAASKGHVDVLRKLASAGGDLAASDNVGSTLLHRAAAQGRVGVIDYLVDQPGVALEARNGRGQTPLLTACEAGQDEAAIRLAKHGANIDARDEDKNGINELASKLVSILRQIKNEM
jgi:26S proteasome non-ATPase regulatory subunit 10